MFYACADVARSVSGPLSSASCWVAAYQAYGTRYNPVSTFATDFSPAADFGASEYRQMAYSTGCNCVNYASALAPVG